MIETIQYTCKFCGQARVFECDQPDDIEARFSVDKMRPLLTCNPCADHETQRRQIERGILATAKWVEKWRGEINGKLDRCYTQDKTHELREQMHAIENRANEILTVLTKRFAWCVCKFKGLGFIWEEDFVELILKSPENCHKHLWFYRNNVAK